MTRAIWIDAALGALGVAVSAATGAVSAYVSPVYRDYLYALCAAFALVTLAQTTRAIRSVRLHEVAIAELRAGQEYLVQPESYRQFRAIFQHHEALQAAEDRFQANFDIDSHVAAATIVRCKACGWRTQQALLYARQAALEHLDEMHLPEARRRWRDRLRV